MKLVDPKWGTHKSVPLDGAASTVDDLDDRFGFQFPNYRRPPRFDPARTKPVGPDDPNNRPVLEPGSVPQTQRRVKKK
jgi:hypothetical protein